MKICLNCKTKNIFDGAQFCRECGAPLDEGLSQEKNNSTPIKEEADFVVTETAHSAAPDFIGSESKVGNAPPSDDDLQIRSTASLLEDEANEISRPKSNTTERQLIGDSAPPIPPVSDYSTPPAEKPITAKLKPETKEKAEFKKLSQEELANIRKNLYQTEEHPADKSTATNLIEGQKKPDRTLLNVTTDKHPIDRISPQPEGIRAIEDPAHLSGVQKAQKIRGVAFFRGNFIQLVGNAFLHEGDELIINDKPYLLKPKQLGKKMAVGLFAGIMAIALFIIGLQFINPTISGEGEIIGFILDENRQPYLEGARVSIPTLNKTTRSNAQGFFRFELVPTGTYELVYELSGSRVGKTNATVTSAQVTLMAFGEAKPSGSAVIEKAEVGGPRSIPSTAVVVEERRTGQTEPPSKTQSGFGKIELVANVSDARLSVDGKVIGSGNNIYQKITSGSHVVKIDKPGFSEYSAEIDLKPNQTVTINANLRAVSNDALEAASTEDHLIKGNLAFAAGDYQKAIDEYSGAITIQPSSKDAYQKRAEAYAKIGNIEKAAEDYIRLGEIYRIGKLNAKAMSAFNSALSYEQKNKIALVGRGGARLDNGEYSPALTDFESALKIDDKFYPALFGCGVSHYRLGNNKQADKHFKNAYKQNQNDPYLYQYMMLNYLALDDVKKLKRVYADYKVIASPQELAELKSSSRFAPILRLIEDEER